MTISKIGRNVYEDSDVESEPQEIAEDETHLDAQTKPDNKYFTLAPPKIFNFIINIRLLYVNT